MQQFLEFVVRELIDRPEEMVVSSSLRGGNEHCFLLALPRSEVGKVIGKQGHTIRAIRGLLMSTALRHGETASLEIVERRDLSRSLLRVANLQSGAHSI